MKKQALIAWIVAIALVAIPLGAATETPVRSPGHFADLIARAMALIDHLAANLGFVPTDPGQRGRTGTGLPPLPPPPPEPENCDLPDVCASPEAVAESDPLG